MLFVTSTHPVQKVRIVTSQSTKIGQDCDSNVWSRSLVIFYPQIEDLGKKINKEQTINSDKQNTKKNLLFNNLKDN